MDIYKKHAELNKKLQTLSVKRIGDKKVKDFAKPLADKHRVSSQTIINYLHGLGSDGLLKMALIEDLETV